MVGSRGARVEVAKKGMEAALGELRRTPEELFDQVAAMVASGYMEDLS